MANIDKEQVVDGKENPRVWCLLCTKLLLEPMQCSTCHNNYCTGCIIPWISARKSCPKCNSKSQFGRPDPEVVSSLQALRIRCPHSRSGCPEVVPRLAYDTHCLSCPYGLAVCQFQPQGCPVKLTLQEIRKHEAECEFAVVTCDKGCAQSMTKKEQAGHSCIAKLKDAVLQTQKECKDLKEELKEVTCAIAKGQYRNVLIGCDGCHDNEFEGPSYHCATCGDFDLCRYCYKEIKHPHPLVKTPALAFLTELLTVRTEPLNPEKNSVICDLSITNYDPVKRILRFECVNHNPTEYLMNDFFELGASATEKHRFVFIVDKENYKGTYKFYLSSLEFSRYYGLPFDVVLS